MAEAVGHNSGVAPAEDAVIALNLGKLRRAKEEFESANGSYRNVVKHVEGKGIHMKAAKRALAIAKADDRDEIVEELQKLFEYLAILGVPLKREQLDLFRVEEKRTPGVEIARQDGRYAGIMGLGQDTCPHDTSSKPGQAWLEAWYGGNKERELVLAMEPAPDSELIKGEGDTDPGFTAGDEEWDAADPELQAAE
ncbi:MAG TPA: hypothetical protein VGN97_12275 [Mesorhizobium sp.]|jgi:ribosome modulation factor/uncharacterized protein (UPF0335 family)|nr:hypothetical protein [Mesorhizobium sp.]